MKIYELIITFKYFTFINDGLINGRTKTINLKIKENLPSYMDIERECKIYCDKHLSRCEYFGIIGVEKKYMIENEDRIKPILEELGITPKDEWKTVHDYRGRPRDYCYYYTFIHKNKEYCVSGDSISFVFSKDSGYFFPEMLYQGYDIEKLKKAIRKVLKK